MQFLIALFALLPMAICGVQPPGAEPADINSQAHLPTSHDAAVGTIEVHPVPSPVPITGPTTFSTLTTSHSRVHQSGHSGTTQGPPRTLNISTAVEVPVTVTMTVTEFNQSVLFTSVASDNTDPETVSTTSSDVPTDTTPLENWSAVAARSVPSDTTPAVSRYVLTGYKLQCKNQTCSSICVCSDEGILQCRPGPIDGTDCPAECNCLKTTTSSGEPGIPTPTTPPVATRSVPSDTTSAVSSDVPTRYKLQCTSPACFSNCRCSDKGVLQCQLGPMSAPNCGKDCGCLKITTTTNLPSLPAPTTPPAVSQTQPQKRVIWSSATCNTKVEVCSTSTTSSTTDSRTLPFISPPSMSVVDTGVVLVPAASSTSTSLTGSATLPFTSETDSMTLPFTTPNVNSVIEKVGTPVSLEKSTTTRSLPWMSTTPQAADRRGESHL
ncbi:hypothetical protein LQW54_008963 [Pestalotiopsis sp. IQ-011]